MLQQAQTTNNPQQLIQQMAKDDPSAANEIQKILTSGANPKEEVFKLLQKNGINPNQLFK